MMYITNNQFDEHIHLTDSINPIHLQSEDNVKYFDNDGFELTRLEQAYYEYHGISINNGILNHRCDQRDWIVWDHAHFKIDHSLILQRWDFVDEARAQIEEHRANVPQLTKFLKIIPKWGIDFALDYYKDDTSIEVLHIETDYRSYEEAIEAKHHIEQKILNTDWDDFTFGVIRYMPQWIGLSGFEQNDWKAVYWGLNKAEITHKAYTGH